MHNLLSHLDESHAMILESLTEPFRDAAKETLCAAATDGVKLAPFCGFRSPVLQARLWRQSRSLREIEDMLAILAHRGATRLAALIQGVGRQHGRPVTDRMPGQSSHQYGLALDCYLMTDFGEADWRETEKGYETYAKCAEKCGLTAGYAYGDPCHIEWRERPFDPLSPESMEQALIERNILPEQALPQELL